MEKYIHTDDGQILWSESFGSPTDRPLLLIMGAMNQGIFWPDAFCEKLAKSGFFVIRYDHRDTGKSSKVDFQALPYDLNDLAKDAVAVIRGYKFEKATVIGLSMGGYIAQIMAIDHPDVVDRMVLISTSADHRPYMAATMGQSVSVYSLPGPEKKLLDYIHATATNPPHTHEEMITNLLKGWEVTYGGTRPFPREQLAKALRFAAERSPDQSEAFHHALAISASVDRLDSVKQIRSRTLIIHGKFDPLLPLLHAEYLVHHIPDASLQVIEMGHSFMWSWSDEVLLMILNFMRS